MGILQANEILQILGIVLAFFVYVAQMPTFYNIMKKRPTEATDLLTYALVLFSTTLVLCQVILETNKSAMVWIHIVGMLIQSTFVTLLIIHTTHKNRVYAIMLVLILNIVIPVSLIASITWICEVREQRIALVTWLSTLLCICGFSINLDNMRKVVMTKNAQFISRASSFLSILSSSTWLCYGILTTDVFTMVPNTLGIIVGVSEIICHILYKEEGGDIEGNLDSSTV